MPDDSRPSPDRAIPARPVRERVVRDGDRFVLPWRHLWEAEADDRRGGFLSWMWDRWRKGRASTPDASEVPRGTPDVLRGEHVAGECRVTFIGHASLLIQAGGLNVLTDPMFGDRASPLPIGPKRFAPPGLEIDELPEIHAVVLSHDHFDHLDLPTVDRLHERFGDRITWCTPLGYREWFRSRGVTRVLEADWWESLDVPVPDGAPAGDARAGDAPAGDGRPRLRVTAAPAQHWTRRGLRSNTRLWASWSLEFPPAPGRGEGEGGGARVFFVGDSGYWHGWPDVRAELGPWDVMLVPIGAYEPRWFMRRSHMNPEEAVRTWRELGGDGVFVGMHWGAFRLTDEPPLEPPRRTREVWRGEGLPEQLLALPGLGETVTVPLAGRGAAEPPGGPSVQPF